VEDSYVTDERVAIKAGGKMLVVSDAPVTPEKLNLPWSKKGKPASILVKKLSELSDLPDNGFDDIIAFAPTKAAVETLNDKLAPGGTINLVMQGKKFGAPVNIGIGRLHYTGNRWVGSVGNDESEGYKWIPASGELRDEDKVLVIGAGGPMGQMHVIRAVASGKKNITVVATDMDDTRLESLRGKAEPLAKAAKAGLRMVNTQKNPLSESFSYIALMAPIPALVAQAVKDATPGGIVNIFAGIAATVKHEIDLDLVIGKKIFLFGTSGSNIRDMKIVLEKVQSGMFDTNCSLDAVSGMAGAKDGLDAVENRTLAGKIVVYPSLHELPLTPIADLHKKFPTVAAKLKNGQWTKAAEEELLKVAK
jgi:threonine dehydrogenase-like Zn-dependent dehydrogenase